MLSISTLSSLIPRVEVVSSCEVASIVTTITAGFIYFFILIGVIYN